MLNNKRGLGRGLATLIGNLDSEHDPAVLDTRFLPIANICPNPDQPRQDFQEETLKDLADSIKAKGIIQPIVVRPDPQYSEMFQIVAGERRWRAAQLAMVDTLPALVRTMEDGEALEYALIENIQRDSLNIIEEATAYRTLLDNSNLTQKEISQRVGKSRAHIANTVRLLGLPEEIRDMVRGNTLTAGHARALIPADDPLTLARHIKNLGLTVRQTEKMVARQNDPNTSGRGGPPPTTADTHLLQANLAANLATRVSIQEARDRKKGRIVIRYRSLDEFDRIYRLLLNARTDESGPS